MWFMNLIFTLFEIVILLAIASCILVAVTNILLRAERRKCKRGKTIYSKSDIRNRNRK